MLTALNGILIVVLLFWWGVHTGDVSLVLLAFVAAVTSWAVNALEGVDESHRPLVVVKSVCAVTSMAAAAFGLVLALSKGF